MRAILHVLSLASIPLLLAFVPGALANTSAGPGNCGSNPDYSCCHGAVDFECYSMTDCDHDFDDQHHFHCTYCDGAMFTLGEITYCVTRRMT